MEPKPHTPLSQVIFMKYILSYNTKFGMVSAESSEPNELVVAYEDLKEIASKLDSQRGSRAKKLVKAERSTSGRGRGETATILRELESKVLTTGFFSKARTTGETKDRLNETSGHNFTSRKVSQALGILWKKGELKRSGARNYFTYSK